MSRARTLSVLLVCALLAMNGLACGQISFEPTVFYPAGYLASFAETRDFDGDGDLDVIVRNQHSVSLLRNTGTGFAPPIPFFVSFREVRRISGGDYDGDGDRDLAVYCYMPGLLPEELATLTNDGTGNFTVSAVLTIPQGTSDGNLVSCHLNNDLALDIAFADDNANMVRIFINNGSGGFITGQTLSSPDINEITVADVDGDGDEDVLASMTGVSGGVRIFLGTGIGTFTVGPVATFPSMSGSSGPFHILAADLDGNGSIDLVGDKRNVTPQPPGLGGGVFVVLAASPGVFGPGAFYHVGVDPTGLATADLNGDGFKEIIIADDSNAVAVLLNSIVGPFVFETAMAVSNVPQGLVAADVNGDGRQDLLTACNHVDQLAVLINQTQLVAPVIPYAGSGEDLSLLSGISSAPTTGTGNYIKTASAGDNLGLLTVSPGGAFHFDPLFVVADLFPTGGTPGSVPGFSSLHFGLTSFIFLSGSPGGPFQSVLSPGGFHMLIAVPPGLAGNSVMTQSVVLSAAATAGFAASDGHEIQVLQ